jgi:predicted acetyltransferase
MLPRVQIRKRCRIDDEELVRPQLRLRALTVRDELQARQGHRELALEEFDFLLDLRPDDNWPGYLARLDRQRRGLDLPAGFVPATYLIAAADGEVVGRVSIRHELNEFLADVGGHIGYGVRPAFRRRGYATQMLRQALEIARSIGIDRALVTCDGDNVASAATIERCGGVIDETAARPNIPAQSRRYWIETRAIH